jgi:hypothetical protein
MQTWRGTKVATRVILSEGVAAFCDVEVEELALSAAEGTPPQVRIFPLASS